MLKMSETDKLVVNIRKNAKEGFMIWLFCSYWLPVGIMDLIGFSAGAGCGITLIIITAAAYFGLHKLIKKLVLKRK